MSREAVRAVIDIGTNTVLMVVGRWLDDGSIEILDDAHAIARLGRGVDAQRRLAPESMHRVCDILLKYRERATALGAESISAHGTSAVRDAVNKEELIQMARQRTGIELTEVPGAEEARLTWLGAGFGLALPDSFAVLDIGGGSTELALGNSGRLTQSASVDVGAVRVTERFFSTLPPSPEEQRSASVMIDRKLDDLCAYPDGLELVGVAGTVTTLAAIDKEVDDYQSDELNGHYLSRDRVGAIAERLLPLDLAAICDIPQVHPQRADILCAGTLILRQALHRFDRPGLTVSTRGIRYGLLMES